jgi:hypothetical protein
MPQLAIKGVQQRTAGIAFYEDVNCIVACMCSYSTTTSSLQRMSQSGKFHAEQAVALHRRCTMHGTMAGMEMSWRNTEYRTSVQRGLYERGLARSHSSTLQQQGQANSQSLLQCHSNQQKFH